MSNVTGFKSGYMPVAANATAIPVFTILVNDTKPIWIHCSQTGHCGKGMVGAINAYVPTLLVGSTPKLYIYFFPKQF